MSKAKVNHCIKFKIGDIVKIKKNIKIYIKFPVDLPYIHSSPYGYYSFNESIIGRINSIVSKDSRDLIKYYKYGKLVVKNWQRRGMENIPLPNYIVLYVVNNKPHYIYAIDEILDVPTNKEIFLYHLYGLGEFINDI